MNKNLIDIHRKAYREIRLFRYSIPDDMPLNERIEAVDIIDGSHITLHMCIKYEKGPLEHTNVLILYRTLFDIRDKLFVVEKYAVESNLNKETLKHIDDCFYLIIQNIYRGRKFISDRYIETHDAHFTVPMYNALKELLDTKELEQFHGWIQKLIQN